MINCGSGSASYFGAVLVPVLAPVPIPDPDLFSTVFQQQKNCTKSCLSRLEAALFTRKLVLNFNFLTSVLLDSGPNPVPEQECITVPVPLKQKIAVPVVSVP
jgi:hypothetical protein